MNQLQSKALAKRLQEGEQKKCEWLVVASLGASCVLLHASWVPPGCLLGDLGSSWVLPAASVVYLIVQTPAFLIIAIGQLYRFGRLQVQTQTL